MCFSTCHVDQDREDDAIMQASPRRTTEKLEEEGANEFGKDGDPEGWHSQYRIGVNGTMV